MIATLGIKVENGQVVQAARSMDKLTVASAKTERATQRLSRRMSLMQIEADRMNRSMGNMARAQAAASSAMSRFGGIVGALAVVGLTKQYVELSDAYKNMTSRLALVTRNSGELAIVQAKLFAIAQEARTPLAATAELYERIARNAGTLGMAQSEVLRVTETINKAMVVSGASAQASQAALVQLGQAFASGTLRGEELNSVMEQAPRLAQAIADGMGVSVGRLRELGKAGALTAKEVTDALQTQAAAVDREFSGMAITVSGAMTQVRNALLKAVGEMDRSTAATAGLADAISGIAGMIGPAFNKVGTEFSRLSMIVTNFVANVRRAQIAVANSPFAGKMREGPWHGNEAAKIAEVEAWRQAEFDRLNGVGGGPTVFGGGGGAGGGGGTGGSAGAIDKSVEAYKRLRQSMQDAARGYLEESRDLNRSAVERAYAANAIEHERRVRDINTNDSLKPYRDELIRESLALRESADAHASRTEQVRRATEAQKAKGEAIERALENARRDEQQAIQDAAQQALELRRMMQQTMSDGFKSIFTDGLTGFRQFFDSVKAMFINFAADLAAQKIMDKIMGTSSTMTRGQGLAASAGAGFAIGGATESGLGGAIGGVGAALAMGVGPLGAFVGGMTGLVSGLVAGIDAARKMQEALYQFDQSVEAYHARAIGDSVRVQEIANDTWRAMALSMLNTLTNVWGMMDSSYQEKIDAINAGHKAEQDRIDALKRETDAVNILNRAMINLAPGYKGLAGIIYGAADAKLPGDTGGSTPPRTPRSGGPGPQHQPHYTIEIPVSLNGREVTRVVVDDLQSVADGQGSDHWSEARL